ncbi:hypothetical protein DUNSADRAFT_14486 [Dunaliella salina]|uniref:Encoded protein n=1 Tax=Dunaliella salina TaxID=3046 RepID=A0ABQ7H2K4_DUNSA|nr:hypothetical protein DUNSADRAFT_14486 [Dunaliella salina]|eukprot:KAF5841087.1 hypothetical protein DUNSADRAFT_14486 [Dunaliella salina]
MNISTCLPHPSLGTSKILRGAHALPHRASPRPSSQQAQVLPTLRPSHSPLPLQRLSTRASAPGQAASSADSSARRRPKRKEELHDPAPIGATGKATTRVKV